MKIPYGISDFHQLRTEGYFYADKTRYIELLESLPMRYIIFLRSRRFGKTLFANMLGWYYNQNHGELFGDLFRGTYIFERPTPARASYMVLSFNFSGINTQTLENANEGFTAKIRSAVNVFTEHYHEYFKDDERRQIAGAVGPSDILNSLFETLRGKGIRKKIYVIIDEYDHFANNILSQGKSVFKDLVRTDGYVRPFYEALKQGTESVADRIFITGVMPVLLDSLTSGFNIGMNLSTDARFNAMLGFTDDEITPILEYLNQTESREIIRTYYDGYCFSPDTEQRVYNSDMILYHALTQPQTNAAPVCRIDRNVVSDYRKIRAVLSIGEKSLEEEVLTRIVAERQIHIHEIAQLFILTEETEFLFDEDTLGSLLFYMGYLTVAGKQGISTVLRIPNLVMESLYLEYMTAMLTRRADVRIRDRSRREMLQGLLDGQIGGLIGQTEALLKGLSNRDYQNFDEKYIKVVMLSLLSDVNIYIPHSEYEVCADGYADIYLQAVFEPEQSAHYFIELKYVKAGASKKTEETKAREGRGQLQKYLRSPFARKIPNLQAYVLVFRKDRCVKKIQVMRDA
jgi:hypothetical protein